MKALKNTLLILLALILALLAVRNVVIKREARRLLAKETGFQLDIGKIDVGLFSTSVDIHDLKLSNPPDFPEPLAFDVRQIKADYDFGSIFRDEVHLSEVVIDVPLVVVVKKEDGETNLQRLSGGARKSGGGEGGGGEPSGSGGKAPAPTEKKAAKPFRIDTMILRIGTVEIHDYSVKGEKPGITRMTLNLDQEHHNITSVAQIGTLLTAGAVGQIGDRFFRDVNRNLKDQGLDKDLKKVSKSISNALQKLIGKGEK